MVYRVSLSILVAAGFIGTVVSVASAADEPQSDIDAVILAAYQDIVGGCPYDAAVKLLGALRDAPDESVESAGEFTDAVYVLAFDVAFLLDWPLRTALLGELTDGPLHPSEELLITAGKATMGLSGAQSQQVLDDLMRLAESPNRPVACAALYFLSSPHFFGRFQHRNDTMNRLLMYYPESGLGNYAVRLSVYHSIEKAVEAGTGLTPLLRETPFEGHTVAQIAESDAILAASLSCLADLTAGSITPGVISKWIVMLAESSDDDERAHFIRMLKTFRFRPDCRQALEPVLQFLAVGENPSSAREFAREIMLEYAVRDKDLDKVAQWANALLEPGRMPSAPEESIIASHLSAVERAERVLADGERYEEAMALDEALATKYPSSVVAEESMERYDLLEAKMAQPE